jgi:hypothetical protein
MNRARLGLLCLIALVTWIGLGPPESARAATNVATGGIGGIDNGTLLGGDGSGAARFTINTVALSLIKQARDVGGVVLPDGADVYPRQELFFVVYVDNPTAFPTDDVQITDDLDESQFTYINGSLEETLVPSGSDDAGIWAGAWIPLSDQLGGPDDTASITDSGGPAEPDRLTIGARPGQVNQRFTLPSGSLRAIRFRVRVN